jgi:hypothetical protein
MVPHNHSSSVLVLLAVWIHSSVAFVTQQQHGGIIISTSTTFHRPSRPTLLHEQPDEWKGFNPLAPTGSSSRGANMSTTRISLRQTRMQELTLQLWDYSANAEKMQEVLTAYEDFLLEPILDLEAVLEQDSIYVGATTVAERFAAYQVEMKERISKAKTGPAKAVLTAMMEFVATKCQ